MPKQKASSLLEGSMSATICVIKRSHVLSWQPITLLAVQTGWFCLGFIHWAHILQQPLGIDLLKNISGIDYLSLLLQQMVSYGLNNKKYNKLGFLRGGLEYLTNFWNNLKQVKLNRNKHLSSNCCHDKKLSITYKLLNYTPQTGAVRR